MPSCTSMSRRIYQSIQQQSSLSTSSSGRHTAEKSHLRLGHPAVGHAPLHRGLMAAAAMPHGLCLQRDTARIQQGKDVSTCQASTQDRQVSNLSQSVLQHLLAVRILVS
jgi:hypothetical protein